MREWSTDDLAAADPPPPTSIDDYALGGSVTQRVGIFPTLVPLRATPFIIRDPREIPPRQWLFGRHYIRRFVSATVAPAGVGKTSLGMVEAVSMASGHALLGGAVASKPLGVWVINLEDPSDELERRAAAVIKHYRLTPADIADRLFVDSGRQTPIKLATRDRDQVVVAESLVAEIIREIRDRRIDVLIVDPFVSSHNVPENDNGAIDRVAKTWARIADETNCAVELVHHVRKPANGAGGDFTVDDARGAVALIGAVRSARVLNIMSKEDAERAGIEPECRRSYFRVDDGKSNMAPPVDKAEWRKLVGVPLDNGTTEDAGDWVGVVEAWQMPSAFEGLSAASLRAVQDKIAEGEWAENVQASNWVGHAVADALDMDVSDAADKQKIKTLLKTWIRNKALRPERIRDNQKGREKTMIRVGEWV